MLKFVFVKDVKPGDLVISHNWKGEGKPTYELLMVGRNTIKQRKNYLEQDVIVHDIEYINGKKDPGLSPDWTLEIVSLDGSETSVEVIEARAAAAGRNAVKTIEKLFKKE